MIPAVLPAAPTTQRLDVTVTVDVAKTVGPMTPLYRFFGADEPNYAYMKDGRRLLSEIGKLGEPPTYFRAHNLLSSGDLTPSLKWGSTNVYTEDANGQPVYDFTTVDRIIDAYRTGGVRPYVQLGFMPEALSTHPQPYRHEWRPGLPYKTIMTGWSYPPKSYDKWRELCRKLTEHFVEKYGKDEVERWYFECWNEANGDYWHGSAQDWYKLHDYAMDGVRQALPTARVGGPHTAGSGGKFMTDFLEHCLHGTNYATGKTGTPLDFLSFHAKGAPSFVDGHVRMGIAAQLRTIDEGLATIAKYPELKNVPVVIGECDPDGCAACQGPQLGYRNGTMYSSFTAASFARFYQINDAHGTNLQGALTWAFEFEDQPYFAGQRVLATNGVVLPVFNVFRMLAKMTGNRVATSSTHQVPLDAAIKSGVREAADVGALAARDGDRVTVLLWHYHDDDQAGPDATIDVQLNGLPDSTFNVVEFRVDATHSNAHSVWKSAGGPVAPDTKLYDAMKAASDLTAVSPASKVEVKDGRATLKLALPRQGVSLLTLAP
jgi:xylan 1,4-beta-xylosidase